MDFVVHFTSSLERDVCFCVKFERLFPRHIICGNADIIIESQAQVNIHAATSELARVTMECPEYKDKVWLWIAFVEGPLTFPTPCRSPETDFALARYMRTPNSATDLRQFDSCYASEKRSVRGLLYGQVLKSHS